MANSPQIIICNNPPTAQGLAAPQYGPSIVIVPGGGAGGQQNQGMLYTTTSLYNTIVGVHSINSIS